MQKCPGVALNSYLKKQRASPPVVKSIMRQVFAGIDHMHASGFAHRDMKIENLMFCEKSDKLMIVDFGFSLECTPETKEKLQCGTPLYQDPALANFKTYSPQAVDVWACGVIFYKLVTGNYPFPATEYA